METSQVHWFLFHSRSRDTTWEKAWFSLGDLPTSPEHLCWIRGCVFLVCDWGPTPRSCLYVPSLAAGTQSCWDRQVTSPRSFWPSSVAGLSWTGAVAGPRPALLRVSSGHRRGQSGLRPLGDHRKSPRFIRVFFTVTLTASSLSGRSRRAAVRGSVWPAVPSSCRRGTLVPSERCPWG